MKRIVVVVSALFLLSACSSNNRDMGFETPRGDQQQSMKTSNREHRDIGLNLESLNHAEPISNDAIVPSEPDIEREETVHRIVDESEKYLGQKMDDSTFITQVFDKVGITGITLNHTLPDGREDVSTNIQPGDIIYFDLDGDGRVDHHAIKLGNGDIIHSYTDGKVRITDMIKAPEWKRKIVYAKRVF